MELHLTVLMGPLQLGIFYDTSRMLAYIDYDSKGRMHKEQENK